jgi:hypothetical protein
MNTLEFLTAVLPPTGTYCLAELSTKKKEHVFATDLQDFLPHIERFNEAKLNVFFALASFTEAGSRKAENALAMRSLFLDIDCGEGKAYPTQKAAVEALDAFTAASGMPMPWLVSSGGGVHAYWPFTEAVDIVEWKLAAENFKRLCKQYDLKIDFTVPADAARVLRVPGTFNWKNRRSPRPVVLKVVAAPQQHEFSALVAKITDTLKEPQSASSSLFNVPGKRLPPVSSSHVKVLEDRITFFRTIVKQTVAGKGCAQLKHYVEHAAEEGMEPLWRGVLSLAKVCEDGEKAAVWLSELHPYAEPRMRQKLREIKGPYPCVKFDSENPGICPSCPFWGRITNPLVFGHTVDLDNTEKQIEIVESSPVASTVVVTRPLPPAGFAYGANGGIYRIEQTEDAEGNPVSTNKLILLYDLFVVDLLSSEEDGHIVQLLAMRPEGPVTVLIPQRAVVSKDETVKALAEQNVVAAYGSGNDPYLFRYVRACVEEVSASRKAIIVPTSFGWQKDDTFVLNSKIYSAQGEKSIPMTKLSNITTFTTPAGTLDAWKRVVDLLIIKKHYEILAMALVGFGSPLMRFTGFNGLTFHIGSSESGTGKSVALNLAASVWGSPQYIVNARTSSVAQEQRLGDLGSMPLIIDEITEMNKDFEWISAFVMDMTIGLGKERMKAGTNEERRNYTIWCALMLLASNTHATDFFSGVRQKASEGHLRRLLETKMDTILTWTHEESEKIALLQTNYGVAGHKYVQWLVRNIDTAREVTRKVHRDLKVQMQGTGDERFWMAGVASLLAAGILIGKNYADIVNLPMTQIVEALKDIVQKARFIVSTNKRTAEDVLNAYTREFFGNFVVVQINKATNRLETTFGDGAVIDKTLTRSQVKGRVEHDIVPGHINYYIEEQLLKAWCSSMNFGYADFKRQLEQKFLVVYGRKDMLSKTRGPQMRVNVLKITRRETPEADEIENHVSLG